MTASTAELGLRERKKTATRQALHEAALRLAIKQGADRITVEAIADAAGVSRRTFSNYFANKEEALLYGDLQRIRTLIEMVRARPVGESPWTALTRAAEEFYEQVGELDPAWVARSRLMRTHPTLIAAQVQTFATLERELSVEVSARAEQTAVRAQLTAAVFLAAMRVSLNVWLDQPAGTSLWAIAEDSLGEAAAGFGD